MYIDEVFLHLTSKKYLPVGLLDEYRFVTLKPLLSALQDRNALQVFFI